MGKAKGKVVTLDQLIRALRRFLTIEEDEKGTKYEVKIEWYKPKLNSLTEGKK